MRSWRRGVVGLLVGAAVCAAAPVAAQPPAPRAAVWVASGAFFPADDVLSEAYGQPQWPLIVQGEVRVAGPVWLFAGVRRLARDGETVAAAPGALDASYPLELRTTSVRVGGSLAGQVGRVQVAGGVGAEYASGEERWPTEGLAFDIAAWGVLVQGSVRLPVWRHLACLGLIEYSFLPADPDDVLLERVDLGGITLGGGVLLTF